MLREICIEKNIPFAVERSRSGDGAHVWLFFKENISEVTARKFVTALLTYAIEKRHEYIIWQGINLILKSKIHQKFSVIDEKVVDR